MLLAFLAMLFADVALGQERQPCPARLSLDQPCTAVLGATDAEADSRRYRDFEIELTQGQGVRISMASDEVDSALEVYGPTSDTPAAVNEDARPNVVHARLYFFPPQSGIYRVRARGGFRQVGQSTLAVARIPGPPRPQELPEQFEVVSTFQDGGDDPVVQDPLSSQQYRYALYLYRGRAGERLQVEMLSVEVDSSLELTAAGVPQFRLANGFSPNTRDARLIAVLPHNGAYTIRAMAPVEQSGAFRIRLRSVISPQPEEPEPLTLDQPLEDRELGLESGVQFESGGSGQIEFMYETFTLDVTEGTTVIVDLASEMFDPVLDAGVDSPLGFARAATDDDSGDGLNSRLTVRPEQSGPILLRVRSLGLGRGKFSIRASLAPQAPVTSGN